MTEEQIAAARRWAGGALVAIASAAAGSQAPLFDLPSEADVSALRERVALLEHRSQELLELRGECQGQKERVERLERWFERVARRERGTRQ